jgi:hypothetical protein
MEGLMRRACILLLAVCAVLAVASSVGVPAQAGSKVSDEPLRAPSRADPPPPNFRIHLPLVAVSSALGVWTTVVEEGFETPPGDLWDFWDFNEGTGGYYHWARRDCRPYAGSYSAWAVGGGASGALLACASNYPDNVDSWMAYGPFSLEDATAASLSFRLWLDIGADDDFRICVSPDGDRYACRALTYQPDGWGSVPFPLDNNLTGFDMRRQAQVWVALNLVSGQSANSSEGAYVDDVVIRKCTGGICQTLASAASAPAAGRSERFTGFRYR